MKRILLFVACSILLAPIAMAQQPTKLAQLAAQAGSITASAQTVSTVTAGYGVALVTFHGTYAGVAVVFEFSDDAGTTWYTDSCWTPALPTLFNTLTLATNATSGVYCNAASTTNVRVRSTAYTSGTATVNITPSAAGIDPAGAVNAVVTDGAGDVLGTFSSYGSTPTGLALSVNANVTNVNSNGQAAMSGSAPVVVASDQSPLKVSATTSANGATNPLLVEATDGANPVGAFANFGTAPGAVKAVNSNSNLFIAGVAAAAAASGVEKVGISGNGGASLDQAPGSAAPTNAVQIGVSDGTNTRVPYSDPCGFSAWTYFVISVSANTQIVAGSASKNVYVCHFFLAPVAAAANVNIVESATSGNACATSPTGMMGGATAALGAQLAINYGFELPAPTGRAIMKTATAADAMCIFASAQVTGVLAYVQF